MKSLFFFSKIIILGMFILSSGCSWEKDSSYYLLRHAEKAKDGTRDPVLTQQGVQRANRVAQMLKSKGINKIYSTNYQRTLQTVQPLSEMTQIKIEQYDPRKLKEFAEKIKAEKGTFVIVGHSNTTPQLARLLSSAEIEDMNESQYSDLYLVTINQDSVSVKRLSSD